MAPMFSQNIPSDLYRGIRYMLIGLFVNVFMAAVKITIGILGCSYALIADGIESVMDIFSSAVVLGGIHISTLPADKNHPYGHGKAESLAAIIASSALLIAGAGIAVKAIIEIFKPHHVPAGYTLLVLMGVITTKEILFRFIFSIGQSVHSASIKTEAWHHRSDALTSVAAFIGISIAIIGGPRYASADSWAALAASGIIGFNGLSLLRDALNEIMDRAPSFQIEQTIRQLAQKVDGVVAVEKCRARKSGLYLFVEIHIQVNGQMPVDQAHAIAHRVKNLLTQSPLNIADCLVHIEPAI